MSGSGPIDSEKDGKKMKIRKYILCAGIVGLVALSSGCRQKTDSGATSQAVSEQADTKENAETSGAAGAETEKETAPTVQVVTDDMVPVEADALKDGKIDAFFCTAGAPTTAIVELATTNTINLLEIDDEHAKKLADAHPFYTTYAIPGGSYKGVDDDVQTVAIKATLIASPKLSEETVYNITKAIFENKDEIAATHAKGEELDLEYAVSGISVPFHPGAEKYFKEVGAIK